MNWKQRYATPMQDIIDLHQARKYKTIGLKAKKLHFLLSNGYPVPSTNICLWDTDLTQHPSDSPIWDQLRTQLDGVTSPATSYAIRSSANLEDGQDHSFAGQFLTKLDMSGTEEILQAIVEVQTSLQSDSVRSYLTKQDIQPDDLKMAVLIQEMIQPVVSGISFSKNPMTGMDEVIVEAILGSGKDLVRGITTPSRWVYKWGNWIEKPEADDISENLIEGVVSQTLSIAKDYGEPVDLEWVYDGTQVYWLQVREITTLKDINIYANHISKEFMPGMIKPLVWSVLVPLVNNAWVEFLQELIGDLEIDPMRLAKSFYYRTYFNMGVLGNVFQTVGLPPESIENLMGIPTSGPDKPRMKPSFKTLRYLPRMLRFALDILRNTRRISESVATAEEKFWTIANLNLDDLSVERLLSTIDDLHNQTQRMAYFNIVTTLRMQFFNQLLKRQISSTGLDYEELNLTSGWKDQKQFDPNHHLKDLSHDYHQLDHEVQERISRYGYEEFIALPGIVDFQLKVDKFFERFGYLSDSGNDFSVPPWRESRATILKVIVNFPLDKDISTNQIRLEDLPLPRLRGRIIHKLYRIFQNTRHDRERVNYFYGFGVSLFHTLFKEIGSRFVDQGLLTQAEDIFYLEQSEVQKGLVGSLQGIELQEIVSYHQSEIETYREVKLPNIIFGDQVPPLDPVDNTALRGTPTSRGYYRGPVRVVRGLDDFDKVKEGCVLVIPYSDVGLTPLFAKAGAIVSEAGGILSHSSIVAREFGIPAVVSVAGACDLKDGLIVVVNGYTGELHISDGL